MKIYYKNIIDAYRISEQLNNHCFEIKKANLKSFKHNTNITKIDLNEPIYTNISEPLIVLSNYMPDVNPTLIDGNHRFLHHKNNNAQTINYYYCEPDDLLSWGSFPLETHKVMFTFTHEANQLNGIGRLSPQLTTFSNTYFSQLQ